MRSLVSCRVIDEVSPITFINENGELEEASNIEQVKIGGWTIVAKKNQFEEGQLAVYAEIDTILPVDKPCFTFLEGKRIKTKKLKKVISQGVCFSFTDLYDDYPAFRVLVDNVDLTDKDDLTFVFDAVKYDEYANNRSGKSDGIKLPPTHARGLFPSFIWKTDEERIQNLAKELKYQWGGKEVVATEKLDGSSITIYCKIEAEGIGTASNKYNLDSYNDQEYVLYGICSRNLDLKLDGESPFLTHGKPIMAKLINYCIETGRSLALQGELIGPGIQGNSYGLVDHKIYLFNLFDIDKGARLTHKELGYICEVLDLDTVPFLGFHNLINSMDYLLVNAEGKSALKGSTEREGMVIRAIDGSFSFKVISNRWLLKQKD